MPSQLELSPSVGHQVLMRSMPLALAYDGGDVNAWRRKLRSKLRMLLAIPKNTHVPLKVRSLWKRNTDLGTIEKFLFRAEAGVDVPAYWCMPQQPMNPQTTFICLQGHVLGMHNSIGLDEAESKSVPIPDDHDYAIHCLRRGISVLCYEQRSFASRGEKLQKVPTKWSSCHDAAGRALLLGRTLMGERVFDVERALDYLAARGDVDMKRVGIMGHSGGGAVAMYATALYPQLAYCLPSCSTATYVDSIASIHHCTCNYFPGVLQWMEVGDVLGAISPRPLVIVNGKTDPIFPIASAKRCVRQAKRAYDAAGAGDKIKFVIGPDGHRFYAELAWREMMKLIGR